jgi:5-formyltetrahydrofolate cyclo-ligase
MSDEQRRHAVKRHLRERMATLRRLQPEADRVDRSRSICRRVLDMSQFGNARAVFGYVTMGKEADPAGILTAALESGKGVGLPRVDAGTGLLSMHKWSSGDPLMKSKMGPMEPLDSAPLLEPSRGDLILVPALAVDQRGYRIGRGGGFYDRLLAAVPHATSICIAYDFQLIIESPVTAGDFPVSWVATDRRVIAVEHRS